MKYKYEKEGDLDYCFPREPPIEGYQWRTNISPLTSSLGTPEDVNSGRWIITDSMVRFGKFNPPLSMDEVRERYATRDNLRLEYVLVKNATLSENDFAVYVKK